MWLTSNPGRTGLCAPLLKELLKLEACPDTDNTIPFFVADRFVFFKALRAVDCRLRPGEVCPRACVDSPCLLVLEFVPGRSETIVGKAQVLALLLLFCPVHNSALVRRNDLPPLEPCAFTMDGRSRALRGLSILFYLDLLSGDFHFQALSSPLCICH